MPFGYPPFVRDYLDTLIERRLGRKPIPPPDSVLRADAFTPYESPDYPVGADTPVTPRRPSALRQGLASAFSDTGLQSFGSGVTAGLAQTGGFFPALAAGLGTSIGVGGKLRAAAEAGKGKGDLEERRVRAAERQAKAAEDRANRSPAASGHQSRYDVLKDEARFLGEQGVNTKDYYQSHGLGRGSGAGAGGRLTDLDKVAQGLVATKRAPDLNSAYVMARTLTQQPQMVGTITRTVADPNNVFNMTTARVSVARRINPLTGNFELIDEQGNLVSPNDMTTFRQNPQGFAGGTGGPAVAPPPAPASNGPGAAAPPSLRQQLEQAYNVTPPAGPATPAPGAAPATQPPVAPTGQPAAAPGSDFQTSVQGVTEDQIISALISPTADPNLIRLYAAGRGPMGNSTRIKQAAGQALAQGR